MRLSLLSWVVFVKAQGVITASQWDRESNYVSRSGSQWVQIWITGLKSQVSVMCLPKGGRTGKISIKPYSRYLTRDNISQGSFTHTCWCLQKPEAHVQHVNKLDGLLIDGVHPILADRDGRSAVMTWSGRVNISYWLFTRVVTMAKQMILHLWWKRKCT